MKKLLVVTAVILFSACGGTDAGETTATDGPTTTVVGDATTTTTTAAVAPPESPPATDPPSGNGSGGVPGMVPAGDSTVSVDGEPLAPNGLLRCIPFREDEGNLDLTVIGEGFLLFIVVNEGVASSQEVTLEGQAVGDGDLPGLFVASAYRAGDGSWTDELGTSIDVEPFTYTGERVSGSMVLLDFYETRDPVEVAFDVVVPDDIVDCSL